MDKKKILNDLAKLCDKHRLGFSYSKDDDGVIITANNEDIFVGFIYDEDDCAKILRDAAKEI